MFTSPIFKSPVTAAVLVFGPLWIAPANAAPSQRLSAVTVASDRTNIAAIVGGTLQVPSTVAVSYSVLRDNFNSYETCESYRKNYVIGYPYHLASYCTRTKQANGRHWLYVMYDTCPDVAVSQPLRDPDSL